MVMNTTTEAEMMMTHYIDENGTRVDLEGGSVEAIAQQLPEDYSGPRLTVHDEPGFVRGWIGGRNDWRAQ
jgi:hypothetical protein